MGVPYLGLGWSGTLFNFSQRSLQRKPDGLIV
jgi:hypothetical protein